MVKNLGYFVKISMGHFYIFSVGFDVNVVVQFCFWFNFYFLLFLGMVIYDNEFKTKEKKN